MTTSVAELSRYYDTRLTSALELMSMTQNGDPAETVAALNSTVHALAGLKEEIAQNRLKVKEWREELRKVSDPSVDFTRTCNMTIFTVYRPCTSRPTWAWPCSRWLRSRRPCPSSSSCP